MNVNYIFYLYPHFQIEMATSQLVLLELRYRHTMVVWNSLAAYINHSKSSEMDTLSGRQLLSEQALSVSWLMEESIQFEYIHFIF